MIEARELRIGNLVTDEFYDSCKTIIEVDSISDRGINLFIEDDGNYPECAQTWIEPEQRFDTIFGIPLTDEWLLKFGFEKQGMAYVNFSFIINLWTDGELIYSYIGGNIQLNYIHQLQNLYHALANEELTIIK